VYNKIKCLFVFLFGKKHARKLRVKFSLLTCLMYVSKVQLGVTSLCLLFIYYLAKRSIHQHMSTSCIHGVFSLSFAKKAKYHIYTWTCGCIIHAWCHLELKCISLFLDLYIPPKWPNHGYQKTFNTFTQVI
jgi:hypothetical protein